MWIVTIGANYLAFLYRVARASVHLCPFVLMASETDLSLGGPGQYRILHTHHVVAVDAGVIREGMRTCLPIQLQATFMALGTNGILLFGGKIALGSYGD